MAANLGRALLIVLLAVATSEGRPPTVVCHDGEAACDADGQCDGACTFLPLQPCSDCQAAPECGRFERLCRSWYGGPRDAFLRPVTVAAPHRNGVTRRKIEVDGMPLVLKCRAPRSCPAPGTPNPLVGMWVVHASGTSTTCPAGVPVLLERAFSIGHHGSVLQAHGLVWTTFDDVTPANGTFSLHSEGLSYGTTVGIGACLGVEDRTTDASIDIAAAVPDSAGRIALTERVTYTMPGGPCQPCEMTLTGTAERAAE